MTVTYAEKRSYSHRYYSSLGLAPQGVKIHGKNPTSSEWDVLGGGQSALKGAFTQRFAERSPELVREFEQLVENYNDIEHGYLSERDKRGDYPGEVVERRREKLLQIRNSRSTYLAPESCLSLRHQNLKSNKSESLKPQLLLLR